MPIITLEDGKLTKEQKRELIHRSTEVAWEVKKFQVSFLFRGDTFS